uniref:Uncharacterized protein n=1 Tax=Mycena chlorophos TaxID=658473 RepID=A0ABQ0LA39_MYCCL|nr:predicted protein [Mycena chlorophos]
MKETAIGAEVSMLNGLTPPALIPSNPMDFVARPGRHGVVAPRAGTHKGYRRCVGVKAKDVHIPRGSAHILYVERDPALAACSSAATS